MCVCVCLSGYSCVWIFAILWTVALKLLCPWDFPGKNKGVSCHFLLQGILLTQESNPCLLHLLHWWTDSLTMVPPGKPYLKYMWFINSWNKEVHIYLPLFEVGLLPFLYIYVHWLVIHWIESCIIFITQTTPIIHSLQLSVLNPMKYNVYLAVLKSFMNMKFYSKFPESSALLLLRHNYLTNFSEHCPL